MPFGRTRGAEVQLHSFFTSALATLTGRFSQGNNLLNMSLVGHRAGLDVFRKEKNNLPLPRFEPRNA
jgi:hypothetical protein